MPAWGGSGGSWNAERLSSSGEGKREQVRAIIRWQGDTDMQKGWRQRCLQWVAGWGAVMESVAMLKKTLK